MIVNTANKISFILVGLSIIFVVLLSLIINFFPDTLYLEYVFIIIIFGFVLYFIYKKLLRTVILNKLKPIFNVISKVDKNILLTAKNEKNILANIENELKDWEKNKNLEIENLRSKEEFRKEFLGNVSHELKTPVFNIQGYVLTLLDGGINNSDINVKYLGRAEKSINRLISLIEDLDTISKIESNVLELNNTNFNIITTVNDIIESLEIKAVKKNISIKLSDTENNIIVNADKYRIGIVLTNLILNSISYGKEGGETIISINQESDKTLIKISDNGMGIPKSDLPRIFERFYRVDKSRSREFGGTGLGLAIVKHIIEAHKQKISVNSKVNKGSTFEISLNNKK